MRTITADEINRVLTYPALIEALREGFRADIESPLRHTHMIPQPGGSEAKYLLMPAWTNTGERLVGCKIVSVYPDNLKVGRPSVYGSYMLMSGETGEPLAVLDGTVLTVWRTACASALAASYLAREDASHLVMVGAGALAPHLVHAHSAVRPIKLVTIWNRTRGNAVKLAFALSLSGIEPEIDDDLEAAVRESDIVSCATLSASPLVKGKWLKKGAHLDLVGAYTPKMREADDDALDAGADAVGFVFFAPSPRNISFPTARELSARAKGRAKKVALTVDADDRMLTDIVEALHPDMLQLHGKETPARVSAIDQRFGLPVMKVLAIESRADLGAIPLYAKIADRLLFDARA